MGSRVSLQAVIMKSTIIYEDNTLMVVRKPAGLATQTARLGQPDLVSELKNYRKSRNEDTYIGVIHRLDQPVEGLLVFAKTHEAANSLSAQLSDRTLVKRYSALICGKPSAPQGTLTDYLQKDARANSSAVVPGTAKGAKSAKLSWKLVKSFTAEAGEYSLVEIELFTGRHHQIRVQMSNAGHPLLGDTKYGSALSQKISAQAGITSTALIADYIEFVHPQSKKTLSFKIKMPILSEPQDRRCP